MNALRPAALAPIALVAAFFAAPAQAQAPVPLADVLSAAKAICFDHVGDPAAQTAAVKAAPFAAVKVSSDGEGTVTWNTEPEGSTPAGTTITVEARTADSEAGLGAQSYVAVSSGVEFALAGRFIQVRVTMQPSDDGVSPVLSELR